MDFRGATGKTIEASFAEFHAANPAVYEHIKAQAFRAIHRGRRKFSIKAIVNWIRWEVYIVTESTTGFLVNDAYTAHYARLFVSDFPQHADRIELRQLRARAETGQKEQRELF